MFLRLGLSTILAAFSVLTTSSYATDISTNSSSSSSGLNASFYKDLNVTRGFVYHYYYVPPETTSKPIILFLHGFPSTSYDWHHQVTFFQGKGYGLIVPDMLGYGGTAKPVDTNAYRSSLISKDIIDILDAENVEQAVVIGHDWGAKSTARLANYYPDRFTAFGFLSVGYFDPSVVALSQSQRDNLTKSVLGYEEFGYWSFFSSNGSDKILEDHVDSFFDLMFTADTIQWITDFAPTGGMQAWLEANKTTTPGSYLTAEDRTIMIGAWRSEGWTANVNWYTVLTSGIESTDDEGIPTDNLSISKPIFFGAALRDYVCVAALEISSILQVSQNVSTTVIREYNTGHWVQLEAADELNADLLAWVESL